MSRENRNKVVKALKTLKPNVEFYFTLESIETENDFNKINWTTGVDENNRAITTTTCPHNEITWSLFKTEYDKL
mgnify:CR=1 FL=1|tara:strand:- start:53 stop:274 length:222 start_codon:yes stop_codon:yes gene_type:complete